MDLYLAALRREFRGNPLLARRVLEEVADHLAEAVAAERKSGMDPLQAEKNAVHRMGAPGDLARQFAPFSLPLKLLLIGWSLVTVAMALWLFSVVMFVLPARDPAHVPLWRGIACAFLAYSALSLAFLLVGPRVVWLRWIVLASSVLAVGFGLFCIGTMLRVASVGGHFEGYMVLMGLLLCGHGLTAVIYLLLASSISRRLHAA